MVSNPFGPSFVDIVHGSNKSTHTTEEVLHAQAEANKIRYADAQALLAERKRKREADVPDHLKAARVKVQEHQERQEQRDIAYEDQTALGSSIQLKLKTNAPSGTSDATLPDNERTIHVEDTDLTATMDGDEEIIEKNVDSNKLDVVYEYMASVGRVSPYRKMVYKIDPKSGARCGLMRSIPNFRVLAFKTMSGLPQVLWRVVHSGSAGAVSTSQLGANFYSQARKIHGTSSEFTNFEMEEIADQLKRHVNGEKKNFNSHWISALTASSTRWIDTRTLRKPALVLPMYGAIKAWSVEDQLLKWRWDMFKHSTLTEWIVWDELDAEDVEEIPYQKFSRPPYLKPTRSSSRVSRRALSLMEIVPEIARTASQKVDFERGRGIPRTALHKKCYYTHQQEAEMQAFDGKVYVKRSGRLPTAPRIVQDDKRSNISTQRLDDIYAIAKPWRSRKLIFIWIISLLTRKHYLDDMVQAIVDRYANVIGMSLDVIENSDHTNDHINRKVLKHDVPGPYCSAKVDVNGYQELMKACIEQWYKVDQEHHNESSGLDVYFMDGEHQTERRLLLSREKGLLGRCETVDLLPVLTADPTSAKHPDVSVVKTVGKVVGYVESHEECVARRAAQYGAGTKVLAPDVPMRHLGYNIRKLYGQRAKMKIDEMKTSTPVPRVQQGLTESVT
ncbi:hypothetical protein LTR70_009469 [Exophiala xenobiotica]|uniref:Uncharacterized protein n=1 Tax=Lithohypha guttulata TaxID=1690604 RepID=A0ABR0JY42_9EURO|nr:hypothetical protein LTR24_009365 [Lithohypha guttulata]KAK5310445.1 hypothetical protein LTR70_009469 [Exophiala xenobiotica]